jgi:hypothetical protein
VTLAPVGIVKVSTARWIPETTSRELRSRRRLDATRGWFRNTVRWVAPCLFGLYTCRGASVPGSA